MPAADPTDPRLASRRALLRGAALAPAAVLVAACDSGSPSSGAASASATPKPSGSPSASATASPSGSPSATASSSPSEAAPLALQPDDPRLLTDGLDVPWAIAFLPGGSALVSSRDTGRVLHVARGRRTRTVGTVPSVSSVTQGGETGLLGLALHPRFASEPWVYAYRTTGSGNEVVRMRYTGGRLGRPEGLLDGIRSSLHHNGGGLVFGPDGHLFVSTGDAEDKPSAQDRSSLNGKVLRLDERGRPARGNPFGTAVWTTGHRNVEGLAFDPTGELWASEFGDKKADELNRIVRGGDYGWPAVEGGDGRGGYRDPLVTWPTEQCSPSGIAIAHGRAWLGALQGQCVFSVVLHGSRRGQVQRHFGGDYGRLRAVAAAPDGSLWVGSSNRDGRSTPRSGDDRLLRVALSA